MCWRFDGWCCLAGHLCNLIYLSIFFSFQDYLMCYDGYINKLSVMASTYISFQWRLKLNLKLVTDNQTIAHTNEVGSLKHDLHNLAMGFIYFCMENSVWKLNGHLCIV